jgi:L-seryl-tRNA(Ser) seleniumtransferase
VVSWDEQAWGFTVADCDKQLRAGDPRIEVLTASNPSLVPALLEGDGKTPKRGDQIRIISMTIQPGEELIVGKRLRDILMAARKKST